MARGETVFVDGRNLTLTEALGVAPGEVVALVGGGGKTTSMFRLANELAAQGGRVLVTTTTHIFPPSPEEAFTIIEDSLEELVRKASAGLESHPVVAVAREVIPDGRLNGVHPDWVGQLREQIPRVSLLVEADGSKSRCFKAPAVHEPVIPDSTDVVVPVVGLSVMGQPLSAEVVHRPERVAVLAGVHLGDVISPVVVADVLAHPEGSAQGAPAQARVVPLLNQADDKRRMELGRQIARELLGRGMRRVVIAALREEPPVREVAVSNPDEFADRPIARRPAVSAVILAAGLGRRMGQLKLGLPLGGKSLLRRVVEAALAAPVDEVVVVLGHGAADLERELPEDARLRAVYNPNYAEGQSSSLRVGVSALSSQMEAAVFLLGDQPLVSSGIIRALVDAFRTSRAPLVQPLYRGVPGNPVLFARAFFPELMEVRGDQGGREVLARHQAEVTRLDLDLEMPSDVDTVADYERLRGTFSED